MKIILDECLPKKLKREIPGHDVTTVPDHGWAGLKNGELLSKVQKEFDVFVTVDRNLSFQQNLSDLKILIIVLSGPSNRFEDLKNAIPRILKALSARSKGKTIRI